MLFSYDTDDLSTNSRTNQDALVKGMSRAKFVLDCGPSD